MLKQNIIYLALAVATPLAEAWRGVTKTSWDWCVRPLSPQIAPMRNPADKQKSPKQLQARLRLARVPHRVQGQGKRARVRPPGPRAVV